MPFYQFKCDKCEERFEERIYLDGKDPPDYHQCPACPNPKAPRELWTEDSMPGGFMKGVCDRKTREMKRFNSEGYNKQQAENFYKEAIQASKDRISTGGEHYKRVVPDMEHLKNTGQAVRVSDKRRVEKIESSKKAAQELVKRLPKK